jgi:hypothetical protein
LLVSWLTILSLVHAGLNMGGRAAVATTEEEVAALSLEQLNAQIGHAKWGYENGGSSQGRKAFFKRLVWLEAQRFKLHGVDVPRRRFSG